MRQKLLWTRNLLAQAAVEQILYILVKNRLLYSTGTSKCSTGCCRPGRYMDSTGCFRKDTSKKLTNHAVEQIRPWAILAVVEQIRPDAAHGALGKTRPSCIACCRTDKSTDSTGC